MESDEKPLMVQLEEESHIVQLHSLPRSWVQLTDAVLPMSAKALAALLAMSGGYSGGSLGVMAIVDGFLVAVAAEQSIAWC